MITTIIIILLTIASFSIKMLIEINGLVIQITKNKELNMIPNKFEENYQFIKGLY